MRIYVKISDKMGEKLDKYANDFGMSKSSFVAYALGKHIKSLDYEAKTYKLVGDKISTMMDVSTSKGGSVDDEFQLFQEK